MTTQTDGLQTRFSDLRVASGLICIGMALVLLGLGAGLVLLIYYGGAQLFTAAVAARMAGEVRPWVEPVLDIEGFGVALGMLGTAMLRPEQQNRPPAATNGE
jgi:hypothetical protein